MIDDLRGTWAGAAGRRKSEAMEIVIGRRFVSAQYRKLVWEVVSISRHVDDPIAHVQLARVGSPLDTKTVSASVLGDRRFYEAVGQR
ncbi:MAG TPA: hypothetical protein VMC10_20650 [Stellaceae bacterium]|nr:hypothetical protein [Stellaceae bacterium]